MRAVHSDVVIVGSGAAGLATALALAPLPVTVLTKTPRAEGGSSLWAQGGIAAAVGPGDSAKDHAADTMAVSAGLADPEIALLAAEGGPREIDALMTGGWPADLGEDGRPVLGREAGHRQSRIVHAGGDASGQALMASLIRQVRAAPSVTLIEDAFAYDLVVDRERVVGLLAHHGDDGWVFHRTGRVVLATGGIGMAWRTTTNPPEATGDGLAIAARAGAQLKDLEFVQFHPTALAAGNSGKGAQLPLLTEALRGAGAVLIDETGRRFMADEHADAELAPRDVVARAIWRRIADRVCVYLDLRPALAAAPGRFPQAVEACRRAGLDPETEPVPVTPAAHYHMGGIATDRRGRTSITGLWACGEVAATGLHGANRLASNSLLEALVFGRRVADDVFGDGAAMTDPVPVPGVPKVPFGPDRAEEVTGEIRRIMSDHVGVLRDERGLRIAVDRLASLADESGAASNLTHAALVRCGEARNLAVAARSIALAALRRPESRGAHHRDDFPVARPDWRRHQILTIDDLSTARETAEGGL